MMPSDAKSLTDQYLINEVKVNNDSAALTELVARHTGIYVNVVNSYSYVPKIERDDMIDHRMVNIYNFALKYDPTRNMKFSTYVAENTKWSCHKKIESEKDEINDDSMGGKSMTFNGDLTHFIEDQTEEIQDKRFAKIFSLRHNSGKKKLSWKKIALHMDGLSHEWCRKIYKRNIGFLKNRIREVKF